MSTKNRTFITKSEAILLDLVVWFANVQIRTSNMVRKRFEQDLARAHYIADPHLPWGIAKEALLNDQRDLREWLGQIAEERRPDQRLALAKKVNGLIRDVVGELGLRFNGERLRFGPGVTGVEAAYAYSLGLLLDDERGISARLGICKVESCRRVVLDLRPAGRPRTGFCSDEHRVLHHSRARSPRARGEA